MAILTYLRTYARGLQYAFIFPLVAIQNSTSKSLFVPIFSIVYEPVQKCFDGMYSLCDSIISRYYCIVFGLQPEMTCVTGSGGLYGLWRNGGITRSISWAARLTWLENAYSHPFLSAGDFQP